MDIFETMRRIKASLSIVKASIRQAPFVRFAFGLTGIASSVGLMGTIKVGNFYMVMGCVAVTLALMVLLYLLTSFTTSRDPIVKLCGRILIVVVVVAFCASIIILLLSVFFGIPKPIGEIFNFL